MMVALDHVPIRTNETRRKSRLFGSTSEYVRRNALAIFRVYTMYEPLKVFMTAAALLGFVAMVIWGRFAYFYVIEGEGSGHVQSLILGAVLFIAAVQLAALGILGDVLAGSRVTQQRILERVRRVELQLGVEPSHYEPGKGAARKDATTGADAGPATGKPEEREALKL